MRDPSALPVLLERIKAATGPSFDLEQEIERVLEPERTQQRLGWERLGKPLPVPNYTASLDAALALCDRVRPGCDIDLEIRELMTDGVVRRTTDATIYGRVYSDEKDATAYADSPALALLAALVAAEMEEK